MQLTMPFSRSARVQPWEVPRQGGLRRVTGGRDPGVSKPCAAPSCRVSRALPEVPPTEGLGHVPPSTSSPGPFPVIPGTRGGRAGDGRRPDGPPAGLPAPLARSASAHRTQHSSRDIPDLREGRHSGPAVLSPPDHPAGDPRGLNSHRLRSDMPGNSPERSRQRNAAGEVSAQQTLSLPGQKRRDTGRALLVPDPSQPLRNSWQVRTHVPASSPSGKWPPLPGTA